jgi:hypothetical protein
MQNEKLNHASKRPLSRRDPFGTGERKVSCRRLAQVNADFRGEEIEQKKQRERNKGQNRH